MTRAFCCNHHHCQQSVRCTRYPHALSCPPSCPAGPATASPLPPAMHPTLPSPPFLEWSLAEATVRAAASGEAQGHQLPHGRSDGGGPGKLGKEAHRILPRVSSWPTTAFSFLPRRHLLRPGPLSLIFFSPLPCFALIIIIFILSCSGSSLLCGLLIVAASRCRARAHGQVGFGSCCVWTQQLWFPGSSAQAQ